MSSVTRTYVGMPGTFTEAQLKSKQKRADAAGSLPALFGPARAEALGISKTELTSFVNDGLLRRQGGTYYKPGNAPTVDEAMLVDCGLTADELREITPKDLLQMMHPVLKKCYREAIAEMLIGSNALDYLRRLYNKARPALWERVMTATRTMQV